MEEEITNNKETINNDAPEEKKTFMHYIKILYKAMTDIFKGRGISNEVLIKRWRSIAVFMILVLIYISNRYTCQQKIAEIGSLEKQLTDIRYEALTLSSELMGSSRQSQVQALIESKGIPLEESKQPPFKLIKKATDK